MELDKTELSLGKIVIILGITISAVVGFYNWVIIPLNNIQVSIAQIEITLTDNKKFQADVVAKNEEQDKRLNALERK